MARRTVERGGGYGENCRPVAMAGGVDEAVGDGEVRDEDLAGLHRHHRVALIARAEGSACRALT